MMKVGATKQQVKFIKKQIEADFHRKYDDKELRQRFFEQQNQNCFLCEQPLQSWESVFTQIEHMIPKRVWAEFYASGAMLLEQILEEANSLKNLRLSHVVCGARKHDYDPEEMPEGLFSRKQKILTEEEIRIYQRRRRDAGSKGSRAQSREAKVRGGRIQGRKNIENGHMAWLQHKGGRIQGRKNVESGQLEQARRNVKSGHIQRLGQIYGSIQGARNLESGHIQALGRRAVESGQLAAVRTLDSCVKGGRVSGRKAVESGQIRKLGHFRYHINRGISKPDTCEFCRAAVANLAQPLITRLLVPPAIPDGLPEDSDQWFKAYLARTR